MKDFSISPKDALSEVVLDHIVLRVYRVKELFQPHFRSRLYKELVLKCRRNYNYYYGVDAPTFDKYDIDSAIYLVSMDEFNQRKRLVAQKWLCSRFVPLGNTHNENEDFNLFVLRSKSRKTHLFHAVKDRIAVLSQLSYIEAQKKIVSLSRVCSHTIWWNKDESRWGLSNYYHYSAVALSLMTSQFITDCRRRGAGFECMSCIMHKELHEKVFTFRFMRKKFPFPIIPASFSLRLKEGERVILDRDDQNSYIYSFPGYFFHKAELVQMLESMIQSKLLSEETMRKFLPRGISFDRLKKEMKVTHFRRLGKLLSFDGVIEHGLTGSQLRKRVNRYVGDGPTWHLTPLEYMSARLDTLLKTLQTK